MYDAITEEMEALRRQREAWAAEEAEGRRQLAAEREALEQAAEVGALRYCALSRVTLLF